MEIIPQWKSATNVLSDADKKWGKPVVEINIMESPRARPTCRPRYASAGIALVFKAGFLLGPSPK